MSDKKNNSKEMFSKWLVMLIFPPYAIFHFFFKSKVKWFIKIPIFLLLMIVSLVAIDQTTNPYRVEDSLTKESILKYMNHHPELKMGTLRALDRQDVFLWNDKTHIVYRTLTTNGLYDFVVTPNDKNDFRVTGVFQTHPVVTWVSDEYKEIFPAYPMAMLYFYQNKDVLGYLLEGYHDESSGKITTTKGTFRYVFQKNKVISVEDEEGNILLKQENKYDIPKEAVKYLKKNEQKFGKLVDAYGYQMDSEKEMYFIRTTDGMFRIDDYRNGNMELMKQEVVEQKKVE